MVACNPEYEDELPAGPPCPFGCGDTLTENDVCLKKAMEQIQRLQITLDEVTLLRDVQVTLESYSALSKEVTACLANKEQILETLKAWHAKFNPNKELSR